MQLLLRMMIWIWVKKKNALVFLMFRDQGVLEDQQAQWDHQESRGYQ